MGINELLQWWNLIYAAPLLISLVWIAATIFGGVHGDTSHSAHAGAHDIAHGTDGAGHDIGHAFNHAAHTVEHAVEHAIHTDGGAQAHDTAASHNGHDIHQHAHDASNDNSAFARILWVLGIGQIPITLLIGIFMLCWGAFGLAVNRFFAGTIKFPLVYIWPSIGVTFVASAIFSRATAAIVGRIMPNTETYGVSRFELIGSLGKTLYKTDEKMGTVDIKDTYGTLHRVQAKTESGTQPIPSGSEVIIIDFDDEDKRFVVRINNL